MKRTFIVLILLIGCICSCNAPMEDAVPTPSLPTEITFSRTTLNEESLPEGARALFNATGAIQMVPLEEGGKKKLKIPVVNTERCIGCGACENLCPARPFSAIYVEGHDSHRII